MANGIITGPPQVDFYKMLGGLGDTLQANQKLQRQQQAIDGIVGPDGKVDFSKAILGQLKAGEINGAVALANLARANSQDDWNRTYQGGMLDLARSREKREASDEPAPVKTVRAAGIDPTSPEGRKALFPKTDTPISATDKKAIFEAEDANLPVQSTIDTLNRAAELAPKAFSGYTAGTLGTVGTNLPASLVSKLGIDPERAKATVELNQLLSSEAIKNMAQTLKGATTDTEMARFTTILADPNAPPELKLRTIDRMKTLAQRQFELNNARIKDLRGGTYFKEKPEQAVATQASSSAFRDGQRATNAAGEVIEFRNGQWVPLK
jgi:hypothetical protein